MREIKFRGWNKKEKYIEPVDDLQMFDNDLNIGLPSKDYFLGKEEVELMQYTGLHDKNGKEIYEGDIIEDEWARYKVIYYLDGFSLEVIKLIKDCGTQLELKYALADFNNECVVIGNIYENKSLLEA